MESNNYLNSHKLLLSKYEKLLSPFGRKVMTSLLTMKMDEEVETNKYNNQAARSRNKKVIKFNNTDNNIDNTNNSPLNENKKDMDSQKLTFQNTINDLPSISKTHDLLKTLPNENVKEIIEIRSVDNFECSPPVTNNGLSKEIVTVQDHVQEPKKIISWTDFFEADIFEDQDDSEDNNTEIRNALEFNTSLNDENHQTPVEVLNVEESEKSDFRKVDNNCDKSKDNNRKRKAPLKSETLKTLKTSEPKKNSLRKEKYTKTVKKWLNNVDPANIVDEDILEEHGSDTVPNLDFYSETKNENAGPSKAKREKRTVQAQLANKNGVMKFSKPNKVVNDLATESKDSLCKVNISSNETKNKNIDQKPINKVKVKKHAKFVAPIKSQLPVKNITFAVNIVDDDNFSKFKGDLEVIKKSEIVAVLVYSNGFCQLNCQHTDESCVPEGIMIQNNDTFFYFKKDINCVNECLSALVMENTLMGYDVKATLTFLVRHFGLVLNVFNIVDVKIGAYLLNPDSPPENFREVQKLVNASPSYTIASDCGLQKTCWYLAALRDAWTGLNTSLMENGLWKVFNIEMRIIPIVTDMENLGIKVDMESLKSMEAALLARMAAAEERCARAAGRRFRVLSPAAVRALLYDELRLQPPGTSTGEATLRSLQHAHPLPRLILQYRRLHKAHATFLRGVARRLTDGDDVVYPKWEQTAAATGRMSASSPNLQAVPKTPFALTLFPESGDAQEPLRLRSLYVSRAGRRLLAADFQHMECRVLARAAADDALRDDLCGEARDLFVELAANWLKKPISEVTSEDREKTKRLLYASLYGAGTRKLMEILNLSYDQVLSIMTSFHRTYPCFKTFAESVVQRCVRDGGRVATACGRARTLPVGEGEEGGRARAHRQAVNFVIQGTAADICKTAMAQCWERLRGARPALDCRLLLQVHDELLWEVRDDHLDRAAGIIKEAMESSAAACGLAGGALPVALRCGRRWGGLRDYTPFTRLGLYL